MIKKEQKQLYKDFPIWSTFISLITEIKRIYYSWLTVNSGKQKFVNNWILQTP